MSLKIAMLERDIHAILEFKVPTFERHGGGGADPLLDIIALEHPVWRPEETDDLHRDILVKSQSFDLREREH